MVAIIHNSSSLRNALHYNENKVRQKLAKFIHSGNYPKDTELLGFSDKISRLYNVAALNQRTKVNSVHISLNFDPSDKLSTEKLIDIADVYMQQIGFGEQPYLVYQHHDAGHPHLHIVTTNIKADGKRIALHNLARNQSMKASKEIEKLFSLVKAEEKTRLHYVLKPVDVQKVLYGKAETKRAITNVLDHVIPSYKYASLAELNAVLQQYNIVADRGAENSRIYMGRGLVYRVLDSNKQKVGVPVKASLISSKPTLKNLESKFEKNNEERKRFKQRVKNAVDFALLKKSNQSLPALMKALHKENIHTMLRQNDDSLIYGITYVDHSTKCVFNGSYLGKEYSAKAILQRCAGEQLTVSNNQSLAPIHATAAEERNMHASELYKVFDDLMQPEQNMYAGEPGEQKKFKKRKKRKQHQSQN